MDLNQIRELIQVMRENQIAEIDVKEEDRRVRIVAASAVPAGMQVPQAMPGTVYLTSTPARITQIPPPSVEEPEQEEAAQGMAINSPIVGTFYRSPSPETPAYVEVNDDVEEDTVLCIVEAMKVMNEIKAEIKGRILQILVENGHPVEFGQPLFRVLPAESPAS